MSYYRWASSSLIRKAGEMKKGRGWTERQKKKSRSLATTGRTQLLNARGMYLKDVTRERCVLPRDTIPPRPARLGSRRGQMSFRRALLERLRHIHPKGLFARCHARKVRISKRDYSSRIAQHSVWAGVVLFYQLQSDA